MERLLLHVERSQQRLFGHLIRMPSHRRIKPRIHWWDYHLAWEHLGVSRRSWSAFQGGGEGRLDQSAATATQIDGRMDESKTRKCYFCTYSTSKNSLFHLLSGKQDNANVHLIPDYRHLN